MPAIRCYLIHNDIVFKTIYNYFLLCIVQFISSFNTNDTNLQQEHVSHVYQKGSGLGHCALSCHKKLTRCSGDAKQGIELNTSIFISYFNMSGSTYVVSSESLAIGRAE